jgi:hypothetical protein
MAEPVSHSPNYWQGFTHDSRKFTLQDTDGRFVGNQFAIQKPFDINATDKTDKAKKDLKKQKDQDSKKDQKKPFTS